MSDRKRKPPSVFSKERSKEIRYITKGEDKNFKDHFKENIRKYEKKQMDKIRGDLKKIREDRQLEAKKVSVRRLQNMHRLKDGKNHGAILRLMKQSP